MVDIVRIDFVTTIDWKVSRLTEEDESYRIVWRTRVGQRQVNTIGIKAVRKNVDTVVGAAQVFVTKQVVFSEAILNIALEVRHVTRDNVWPITINYVFFFLGNYGR